MLQIVKSYDKLESFLPADFPASKHSCQHFPASKNTKFILKSIQDANKSGQNNFGDQNPYINAAVKNMPPD